MYQIRNADSLHAPFAPKRKVAIAIPRQELGCEGFWSHRFRMIEESVADDEKIFDDSRWAHPLNYKQRA
jgi:hypothetical protein